MSESNVELSRPVKKKHKDKTLPNSKTKQPDQDFMVKPQSKLDKPNDGTPKESMVASIASSAEPMGLFNDSTPREWLRNVVLPDGWESRLEKAITVIENDKKKMGKDEEDGDGPKNKLDEISDIPFQVEEPQVEKKKKKKKKNKEDGDAVTEEPIEKEKENKNEDKVEAVSLDTENSEKEKEKDNENDDKVEAGSVYTENFEKKKKKKKEKKKREEIEEDIAVVNGAKDPGADHESEKRKKKKKRKEKMQ